MPGLIPVIAFCAAASIGQSEPADPGQCLWMDAHDGPSATVEECEARVLRLQNDPIIVMNHNNVLIAAGLLEPTDEMPTFAWCMNPHELKETYRSIGIPAPDIPDTI